MDKDKGNGKAKAMKIGFTVIEVPLEMVRGTAGLIGGNGVKEFVKQTMDYPSLSIVLLNESTGEIMLKRDPFTNEVVVFKEKAGTPDA
jgi:hypothetical protein